MNKKLDLEDFCVIPNAEHWAEYKDQLAGMFNRQTYEVNFPPQPKAYPCLVASKVRVSTSDGLKDFEVSSCFVYENDAKLLLSSSVKISDQDIYDKGIVDKYCPDSEFMSEPSLTPEMESQLAEIPSIEPDLSILVLAMLKELVDVGAIKTDRLFTELQPMTDKLRAFHRAGQDGGLEVAGLEITEFIKEFWEAVGKDAS